MHRLFFPVVGILPHKTHNLPYNFAQISNIMKKNTIVLKGERLRAVNVRPTADGLQRVGSLRQFSNLGSTLPLGIVGSRVCAHNGRTVISATKPNAAPAVQSDVLPGNVQCTLPHSPGKLLCMTDAGACTVEETSGGVNVSVHNTHFRAIPILCRDSTPLSTRVPSRKLSKVYGTGMSLTAADRQGLVADMVDAYRYICETASANGCLVQPALARYRLKDIHGNTLFTSPVKLLCHSTGAQCTGYETLSSADGQNVDAYTLAADTFSLSAQCPRAVDERERQVARLELYLSPLFHPGIDGSGGDASLGRGNSSADFVRVALPGRQHSLAAGYRDNAIRNIFNAIAHMDTLESCVATVDYPYGEEDRRIDLLFTPEASPEADFKRMQAAVGKAAARRSFLEVMLRPPHSFSAGCAGADGNLMAWGNIAVHRYAGFEIGNYANTLINASWTGTVAVKFKDGSVVKRSVSGSSGAPGTLSPVLCYPAPDAVLMNIMINCNGMVRSRSYTLVPDASGAQAVFVDSSLLPHSLDSGAAAAIAEQSRTLSFPDAYVLASRIRPFDAVLCGQLGAGAIRAMCGRGGSDQSWEFGRCRFLAGGDSGVFSLAVAANRQSVGVRHLSHGSVGTAAAMCGGENGDTFALINHGAEAGAEIALIGSTGQVRTFAQPGAYSSLSYDRARGELRAVRADWGSDVFCRNYGWMRYTHRLPALTAVDGALGVGPDGIVLCGNELRTGSASVSLTAEYSAEEAFTPRLLELDMRCSHFSGTLSIDSLDGRNAENICTANINGRVTSKFTLKLLSVPRCRLRISLSGTADTDFVFRHFIIHCQ